MLVCSFFAQLRTRDRGCSAHPAFPAPSFEGDNDRQTSGASRRENADVYLLFSTASALMNETTTAVIARLDRAPSIPETVVFNREAAAHWIARS
jgi:hypothetical protein